MEFIFSIKLHYTRNHHIIWHACYCTKHSLAYKIYKDNRMNTTNNIVSNICARLMYCNTPYCKISGFMTIAFAQ